MSVVGLGHVAVGVTDMDASVAFYRDVLGLAVYLDRTEEMRTVNRRRRAVYMRNQFEPYSTFVVLDAELDAEPHGTVNELWGLGVHHFAFWTLDIDEVLTRAAAAGFELMTGPLNADSVAWAEPAGTEIRTALLKDPDGNIVQLDQRPT